MEHSNMSPVTTDGQSELHELGEALAGVNLGSKQPSNGLTFDKHNNSNDGWGNFTDTSKNTDGLDYFLRQSPAQSLGEDVFRLSHPNLPSLAEQRVESSPAFRYNQNLAPGPPSDRRRTESPSCSVTGTTSRTSSRSVSPYTSSTSGDIKTIHAYHGYEPGTDIIGRNQSTYAEDERSSPGALSNTISHGSHPSLGTIDSKSPYGKFKNDKIEPTPTLQQQQQVLYMAVPSPDGRGQVLQPVQMVQLPGQPYQIVSAAAQQQGTLTQSLSHNDLTNAVRGENNRSRVADYALDHSAIRTTYDEDFGPRTTSSASFPVDSAVASLYSAPQRPPLDALLGQIRRLARDQVGCRLVQQALDEEGPMAATMILNEGLPFWGEAMVDPFGNYLFQKILEKITPEERIMLVQSVSPRLVNASLNLHGTRSVQKVVELCAQDEHYGLNRGVEETAADVLTMALAPAAARLCIDSHGNHVIQRILLKLSPKHTKFIFDAVAASVSDVARHRHGCCVIQRCLDSPPSEARSHLVSRIVEKSLELMQDAYGNYVVQYVLDVCSDSDVQAVCASVVGKVSLLAIQKFSSNVMEKCLERCSESVKEFYLQELSDPDRIRELMMDPFGNYVVQRALSVATHVQAVRLVEAMRPHLLATQAPGPHGQRNGGVRNTAGGRRIIAKICRRFPNFTLSAIGSQEELYSTGKGAHRSLHQQPPALSTYAPLGTQHYYVADSRVAPERVPQQQQQQPAYYSFGGGAPFYEPYSDGYPGM